MTREELKTHCKKEVEMCEFWAHARGEDLNNSKIYQEHKLVLELLAQESCEDAISRSDVLDAISRVGICKCSTNEIEAVDECLRVVKALPSVQPKQNWIPVSERLPKIAGVYRVTRCYPNNVMNPNYIVDACFFDGSNNWYNDNRINHERDYANNVIAWQENPEPYKAESEE